MIKKGFVFIVSVLWLAFPCQPQSVMRIDTTIESRVYWNNWVNNLFEMGVEQNNDSFYVKEGVIKALKDSVYRKNLYPQKYEWPVALLLMRRMELKEAFWHLINLYMTDTVRRYVVIATFVKYDSLMAMDRILLSTFYTYGFADPRVCRMNNNKPDIYRPDLLEKHLNVTKEIINYIWINRKKKGQ